MSEAYAPRSLTFDADGRLVLANEAVLRVVNLRGHDTVRLPEIAIRDQAGERTLLAFSGDGRHVATLEGRELSVVELDEGTRTLITRRIHPEWRDAFGWSEDGEHLAYATGERGAPPELWLVQADGSGSRRIVAGEEGRGGAFAGLAWLPGTPYIVYQYVPEGNAATLQAECQVVTAAGGPPKTLFSNGLGLRLSPDRHILSFRRDLAGQEETGSWIAVLEYGRIAGWD